MTHKLFIPLFVLAFTALTAEPVFGSPVVSPVVAQESGQTQPGQTQPTQAPNEIPVENIDGSEVDVQTQNETSRLVRVYQEADSLNNDAAMNAALRDLEALHAKDNKNLSLITWLGYLYTTRGEYAKAAAVLEPALGKSTSDSVNSTNLRNVGACYYLAGQYQEAIPKLKELAEKYPGDGSTHALLGSAYVLTQDFQGAVVPLERARELTQDDVVARRSVNLDLAIAYSKGGMMEKALDLFDAMRADGGLNSVQLAWMGYLYLENGRPGSAIEALEAAREQDADDPAVVNNLANAYLRRNEEGDRAKAISMFEELVRLVPNNATAAYNAGAMYLEQGEYAKARPWLEKATQLANDPFAHNNLGRAYEGMGNLVQAAKNYATASDLRTENAMFAKNAGVTYLKQGNDQLGIKYLERALANGEETAEVMVNLAGAYSRAGNQTKATELMSRAEVQERLEENPDYWFNLGVAAQKAGKAGEAEAHYRKALDLKPDDIDATNNLGVLLYEAKNYEQAYLMFEKLSGLDENSYRAKQNMAACLVKMGRVEDAVEVWKEIVRANPQLTNVRLDLADALWNTGDTPGARFHYAYVYRDFPNNVRAMNGLGLWHLLQNENREAAALLEKAIKTQKAYTHPYRNLAVAYERLNRVADAIKVLEDLLVIDPDNADAKKALARLKSGS